NTNPHVTLYSEDLVIGYRLDAGLVPLPKQTSSSASGQTADVEALWQPLCARDVSYQDDSRPLLGQLPIDQVREDGYVHPVYGVRADEQVDTNTRQVTQSDTHVVVPETLAAWTGDSLAIPNGNGRRQSSPILNPASDLAVNIEYAAPIDPSRIP